MIEITKKPIHPENMIDRVKTDSSGCVVAYVGLIRGTSQGKSVLSVEYQDHDGRAESVLREIASEIRQKWLVNKLAICHRTGKLKVGDINLVVTVACAHRKEGFEACQFAIDRFKETIPTRERETYRDGSIRAEG